MRADGSDRRARSGPRRRPNERLRRRRNGPGRDLHRVHARPTGIHVIRPDGLGRRLLLADAAGFDWSPDGRGSSSPAAAISRSPTRTKRRRVRYADARARGRSGVVARRLGMVHVAIDETDPKVEDGPATTCSSPTRTAATSGNCADPAACRLVAVLAACRSLPRTPGRARCSGRRATTSSRDRRGDLIYGRGGNDVIRGRGGDDIIFGDVPFAGGPGKVRLFGGPGSDFIGAYDGRRDLVDGGAGAIVACSDRHDRLQVGRALRLAGKRPLGRAGPRAAGRGRLSSHSVAISASTSTPVSTPSPSSM